jgi:hypothetical protein
MPAKKPIQVSDPTMIDIGVGGLQAPLCGMRILALGNQHVPVHPFLQVDPKATVSTNHDVRAHPAIDQHVAARVSDALVAAVVASGYADLGTRGGDKILDRAGNG